jgi:two-component system, NarL family, nitrate/nitrite response regulator NarL
MVRTYVVSELRLYRDAFVQALVNTGRVEVVGSASHPADAMSDLRGSAPEALLLDLPAPEGPWWASELSTVLPGLRTLILGLAQAETDLTAWTDAGIAGYLGREACLDEVVAAIEAAVRGQKPGPAGAASVLLRGPMGAVRTRTSVPLGDHGPRLTPRECEILRLVGDGLTNDQIAGYLFIALATVKNHMHNILCKLGVERRIDAVRAFRRAGLVAVS